MGIFIDSLEQRSGLSGATTLLSNPAEWLYEAFGVVHTDSGIPVTPDTAMRYAPVYACVNVLSQSIAQLPWNTMHKNGKHRTVANDRSEHYLLHSEPNGLMSSYTFRVAMMANMLLHGNAYVEIVRDGANRVKALHILPSWTVAVYEDINRERLYYNVVRRNGQIDTLDGSDVIHIPCISMNGISGLSPIAQHRQGIGLGLAAEKAGAAFFGNGSRPSGYLSTSQRMSKDDKDDLATRWFKKFGGAGNTGKVPVLTGDLKWNQLSINPSDAQYIETRKFQAVDTARSFRVPGLLIGIEEKTTAYGSVEVLLISFGRLTIAPLAEAIEQEFNRKLWPNTDEYYNRLDMRGLLRGDYKALAEYYKSLWSMGGITQNETREYEDMDPMPGADRLWIQQGFMPLDKADEILAKQGATPTLQAKTDPADPDKVDPATKPAADKNATRSAHVDWLQDVYDRVSKWERRDRTKVADAFAPVFRSLTSKFIPGHDPMPFCLTLADEFTPADQDFASRSIERYINPELGS